MQQNTSIDAMDRKILNVLQRNGRISNQRLSELADELADSDLTIETVRTVASMRRIKGWVGVPLGPAAGTGRL